ncbi:MAG TPA: low affinity iron permease family protein [Solimonas sp.]|nr:low affinity iron permease family protein [Solimonas sp.]
MNGKVSHFRFARFARAVSVWAGKPATFLCALAVIAGWGLSGPLFDFSDTWQLVINTGTTIVTFLMVFLIQNTQNRDAEALHLKIDELIKSIQEADNAVLDLEDLDDEELEKVRARYVKLGRSARNAQGSGPRTRKDPAPGGELPPGP